MYVRPNFKTKTKLREALEAGDPVEVFQPNDMFNTPIPTDGVVFLEGPHYPEPHKWYAKGQMSNGKLISIK